MIPHRKIPAVMAAAVLILSLAGPAMADGFIVVPPNAHDTHPADPFPLEVVYHRVRVSISDQAARTIIDQAFFNPTGRRLEGWYLFPVPDGAVIQDFTMDINGREASAELLEARRAREIYEDIVRKARDPALLEYSGRDLFRLRIFPIEPRSEKRISITYRQVLQREHGTTNYLYPLNTEKFSAAPLRDVSIHVEIRSKGRIRNIYCPSHDVSIQKRSGFLAEVSYQEERVKPDRDFKLFYSSGGREVGLSLLSHRQGVEDGYFFLSASPAFGSGDPDGFGEKDITFVLDVSGSMAGEKLEKARRALLYCIESLNRGDRFEIIRFSTEAYPLFRRLVKADQDNRGKARDFVRRLRPVGGTNIEEALRMALSPGAPRDRARMIIFITDGKPTIGLTDEESLIREVERMNEEGTRIFTFGIGHGINTHLLDRITESTRGSRAYISPSEDIELAVSRFYDRVQSPVLTDLTISWDGIDVYQNYPRSLPDLFRGSGLTLFGRYRDGGMGTIVLSGKLKGEVREYRLRAEFLRTGTGNDFIPPLWASRRVGHLLDLIRLHGEEREVVEEVTELARTHGIITPYTSYLIMEDEDIRAEAGDFRDEYRTLSRLADVDGAMKGRYRAEYEARERPSGPESVRMSRELKALNEASIVSQYRQGEERLDYRDARGNRKNLAGQVRNVEGRAFYRSGEFWVDSRVQRLQPKKRVRIRFMSSDYFRLLRDKPAISPYLALGNNVRFMLKGRFYEIYE
jgi:Ca-activated chloride channel family protein